MATRPCSPATYMCAQRSRGAARAPAREVDFGIACTVPRCGRQLAERVECPKIGGVAYKILLKALGTSER